MQVWSRRCNHGFKLCTLKNKLASCAETREFGFTHCMVPERLQRKSILAERFYYLTTLISLAINSNLCCCLEWIPLYFIKRQLSPNQLQRNQSCSFNVPSCPSYDVDILQLFRYTRCCLYYDDFRHNQKMLVEKLVSQGQLYERLRNSFKKLYGRCPEHIVKYERSVLDTGRCGGRSARLARSFEKASTRQLLVRLKSWKYKTMTANGKIFGPTEVGVVGPLPLAPFRRPCRDSFRVSSDLQNLEKS